MADPLTIRHPSKKHGNQPATYDPKMALPSSFVALGVCKANFMQNSVKICVHKLKVFVSHYTGEVEGADKEIPKVIIRISKNQKVYHWAALIMDENTATSPLRIGLKVKGYDKSDNVVCHDEVDKIWLKAYTPRKMDKKAQKQDPKAQKKVEKAMQIEWPSDDPYTLVDDEHQYFVPFGISDLPIISATLDTVDATTIEFYGDENFWWAEFDSTKAGNLIITNSDEINQTIAIKV